jgi:anthranilate synthase component 2
MNVLVIDCYDSFTYNLVQLVGALGADPVVVKSDADPKILKKIHPDRVILSPGPGHPKDPGFVFWHSGPYPGQFPPSVSAWVTRRSVIVQGHRLCRATT